MTDTATDLPKLLTDAPAKAKEDLLGFQPHADRLAAMLLKQQFPDASFVVGIEGEWGEGKSTFINCLKQRFEQAEEKGETPPVVVEFNPWWFDNPEKTASNLLETIINGRDQNDKEAIKALEDLLAGLNHITPWIEKLASNPLVLTALFGTNAVFANDKNAPWLGALVAAGLSLMLHIFTKWLSRQRVWSESLAGIKEKAAAALTSEEMNDQKQIVIIDDLDRLSHEEIRQVFRAVKGVLDLPNIVYVIAYDRAIVASALDEVHKGRGEAYLEKIVQLPYRLPKPSDANWYRYNNELFNKLPMVGLYSEKDKQEGLDSIFDGLVLTPRDTKRLCIVLMQHEYLPGEIGMDVLDFIFLEGLRLKYRLVWEELLLGWAVCRDLTLGTFESGVASPQQQHVEKKDRLWINFPKLLQLKQNRSNNNLLAVLRYFTSLPFDDDQNFRALTQGSKPHRLVILGMPKSNESDLLVDRLDDMLRTYHQLVIKDDVG